MIGTSCRMSWTCTTSGTMSAEIPNGNANVQVMKDASSTLEKLSSEIRVQQQSYDQIIKKYESWIMDERRMKLAKKDSNQANADKDTQGDACDPDDDNDNVPDADDGQPHVTGVNRRPEDVELADEADGGLLAGPGVTAALHLEQDDISHLLGGHQHGDILHRILVAAVQGRRNLVEALAAPFLAHRVYLVEEQHGGRVLAGALWL